VPDHLGDVLVRGGDEDVVARLGPVERLGRDRLAVADEPEDEVRADHAPPAQLLADERRARGEDRLRDRDAALAEVLDMDGPGQHDRLGEVVRGRALGVHDEVDAEHVGREGLVLAEVVRVADARDRPLRADLVARQRGDDVRLVALGDPAHEIGVGGAEVGQELGRGAVAGDDQGVELAAERLDPLLVLVDHGHVVALG
jgi:hypothetical protein